MIIYEDEVMLVIDKPSGVVVHPGAGNGDGTIVNALLERYSDFAARFEKNCGRPGIVHRLDKDTSGCLVIAKTPEAMFKLSRAFSERRTHKLYWALLKNQPAQAAGTIENLLGRHPVNRQKMAVVERNGRTAVTKYRVRQTGKLAGHPVALVEFEIFTGRTHQIRVHASQCLNCPVLGDALYGGRVPLVHVPRQMLHARQLTLPHPVSGVELTFTSPLPADFQALLAQITEA